MKKLRRAVVLVAAAVATTLISLRPGGAAAWPTHPVRIVNTFVPGGAADVLARLAADHLSAAFGQQFYVETRAGAGGVIGVQFVAHSEPDGYNFVITTLSLLTFAPITNPKVGYDPLVDLTNVAYLAGSPVALLVNAGAQVKTLDAFVAKAKAAEGRSPSPRQELAAMAIWSGNCLVAKPAFPSSMCPTRAPPRGLPT